MIDVQVSKSLCEDRRNVQILQPIVIPVALHCTTIVILVVPDLSLATRPHDRSDEVDSVLLIVHKLLSSNEVAKVIRVSLK